MNAFGGITDFEVVTFLVQFLITLTIHLFKKPSVDAAPLSAKPQGSQAIK